MSDNPVTSSTDPSRPPADGKGEPADAVGTLRDPEATQAPDMAPTADAFESTATFDTAEHEHGQAGATDADEDPAEGAAPAAGAGWRSRLPGQPRQWVIAGMVCGGVLLGGLASGGIAWKMISSRDAEVAARNARLDVQSSRLAEQQQKIEVLTRAISERPLPEDAAPESLSAPPAPPASPAPPAPLAPPAPPAPPASQAPVAVVPAVAPAAARVEPAQRQEPQPTGPAGIAPGVAGSGICDVPTGNDSAARMRRCIEWFAGRDKGGARPLP
jgi:hypothetical protein